MIARSVDANSVDSLRAAGANAVVVDGLTTALDIAERAILLYEPEQNADVDKSAAPMATAVAGPLSTETMNSAVADGLPEDATPPQRKRRRSRI